MLEELLNGMLVYAVYRCSTGDQLNSIERQREACRKYAKEHGLIIVKEIVLEAKSATQGQQLVYLNAIIKDQIDGVIHIGGILFSDFSRIARIADDAERFFLDARDAGLKIVTQKDGLIAGKHAWIKKGIAGEASEAFGENHSIQTNGGYTLSMVKGLIPHTGVAPYGVDRRFVSSTGEPLCILRRQPGGITLKLAPHPPHEVIETFVGKSRRRCVLRQGNDRIELVPGDPSAADAVRFIYRSFFDEREPKGCHWIARSLNDRGTFAPGGKPWHTTSIRAIIMNSAFSGVGVANRLDGSVHSTRGIGSPVQHSEPRRPGYITPKNEDEPRRKRKRVPYLIKPVQDWLLVKLPALFDYLGDAHLRRRAKAYRRHVRLKTQKNPARQARRGRSNPQYFLAGLITAQPASVPMIGVPTLREKDGRASTYRYYYASRATNRPKTGDPIAARLRADHVEEAFLAALEEVLACPDAVCADVKKFIAEKYEAAIAARADLAPLLAERDEKEEHLKMILRLGPRAKKLAAEDVHRLEARLDDLDLLVREAQRGVPAKPEDTSAIAASIKKQLGELREIVRQRPLKSLRKIAQVFAGPITFNGESRRLDIELRLPKWAMKKHTAILDYVRELNTRDNRRVQFTNQDDGVLLTKSTCLASAGIGRRPPCIACQRAKAA
ncbi:hypothetical protein BH09PLA1_BH09PLA1_01470 [soil metagenome]